MCHFRPYTLCAIYVLEITGLTIGYVMKKTVQNSKIKTFST
ncbi:hypothetical protein HanPSC8_Chr10g0422921 [Helianthus annuus]|nr:hypothetical protein HanPSC8_Chr10g0422921 [Helianthus annuus]